MKPTIDMFSSPHDRQGQRPGLVRLEDLRGGRTGRWKPSRYNARTVDGRGQVLVWNTASGSLTAFAPPDREKVLAYLTHGASEPLDRHGRYLASRGYLVRSAVDEYEQFRLAHARQQWRTDVLELMPLASEDCNFRCVYCYEKWAHGTMLPEVREGIRRLVAARAPQLKELSISWFGGEPLYGWEAIEDLAPDLKRMADEHGMRFLHGMTTNAYLLTEERATRLLEWDCRGYQITVDGLAAAHNCKRVGRDGSETYDVILDNLRSLRGRKARFSVMLRVNFDQDNLPELPCFVEALKEEFAGDARFKLLFRAVGRWGGESDAELNICGSEDVATAARSLETMAAAANLAVHSWKTWLTRPGAAVCYAARPYSFVIGATGKVMKCTVAMDELEENVVGRLGPDGHIEFVDERLARWVNAAFEDDDQCRGCYLLPNCQSNGCPKWRITMGEHRCCAAKETLQQELRATLARRQSAAPAPAGV